MEDRNLARPNNRSSDHKHARECRIKAPTEVVIFSNIQKNIHQVTQEAKSGQIGGRETPAKCFGRSRMQEVIWQE